MELLAGPGAKTAYPKDFIHARCAGETGPWSGTADTTVSAAGSPLSSAVSCSAVGPVDHLGVGVVVTGSEAGGK